MLSHLQGAARGSCFQQEVPSQGNVKTLAGNVAFPILGQVCWVSSLLINQNTSEHEHSHQILFILGFNYQPLADF